MKTKYLLASMAAVAAFSACSDQEAYVLEEAQQTKGLVELGENFMLTSVAEESATRTHWALDATGKKLQNAFMPVATAASGTLNASAKGDEIGLCWVGPSIGDKVYTNYQFFHYGWLFDKQENASLDQCTGKVNNGYTYDEVTLAGATSGNEVAASMLTATAKTVDGASKTIADVNYNSGIYKTENKSIFGGDYIVYYPFDESWVEAGTIPAKATLVFNAAALDGAGLTDPQLGKATFRFGKAMGLKGGSKANGFGFKNLSSIVRVFVNNTTNADDTTVDIDQVVLYSPKSEILASANLSAAKIMEGQTGTALYTETKGTKTITVDVPATFNLAKSSNTNNYITVTALPTNITELKVLLHDATSGMWATVDAGALEIPQGGAKSVKVNVKKGDFKAAYFAVDETSLATAITAAAGAGTTAKPANVEVIGDITIKDTVNAASGVPANVVISGDKLIVNYDAILNVSGGTIIKSAIDVMGTDCCDASTAGALNLNGATIVGDVNALAGNKEVTSPNQKNGYISIANASTVNKINTCGAVDITDHVDVVDDMTLAASAKVKVTGELEVKGAKLVNNGEIDVVGKFAILTATGSTTAAAGLNMTNNGKFIDEVGATIGGATQKMTNNGDYICRVDGQTRLNSAYIDKTACNIIEITGVMATADFSKANKHNNEFVDVVVKANVTTAKGSQHIGNLTVDAGAAFVQGNTSWTGTPLARTTDNRIKVNGNAKFDGNFTAGTNGKAEPTIEVTGNVDLNANYTGAGNAEINVGGNLNIAASKNFTPAAKFTIAKDIVSSGVITIGDNIVGSTASNMILNGGSATFGIRSSVNSDVTTLKVANTIKVGSGATFTITPATGSDVTAKVTCTELVEGGTFVGKPDVL